MHFQAVLSKHDYYLVALEERGRLQSSTDTLQSVKVTVLELQKRKRKPSVLQETYAVCMGRQESRPSQHALRDTTFAWRDAGGVPQPPRAQHPPTDLSPGRVSLIF